MENSKTFNKIIIFFIIVLSFITILSRPINSLDEIWQYNFARNIANGKTPYVDFSIIVTPLFSFLGGCFLKVLGDELIIMRIFTSIVLSLIIIFAYYIFRELKVKKLISIIFTFILYTLFANGTVIDYNCMVLLICEIIILLELKSLTKTTNKKYEILKSSIIGLAILTKQTTGILLCLVYVLYKLLWVKDKTELRQFIQNAFYRIIGICIPVILFIVYLICSNSFNEFINYCILGISEFTNSTSYLELFKTRNAIIIVLALFVPINAIYHVITIKQLDKPNYILTVFSIVMLIGLFPLADVQHFVIYSFICLVSMFYTIYEKFLKNIFCDKKSTKPLIYYAIFAFILYITGNTANFIAVSQLCKFSELNNYSYCLIPKKLEQEIKQVGEYILEKNSNNKSVLILDFSASLYMIPLDKYNKDYDLFMNGNFGKDGNTRLINDIKNRDNTEFLLLNNNYTLNRQTPISILNYVLENYEKTNEVERFDVYEEINQY